MKKIAASPAPFTQGEIDSVSCQMKPNLDCNHTYLQLDLVPNGIPFGSKSRGKVCIKKCTLILICCQSEFHLVPDQQEKCNYKRNLVHLKIERGILRRMGNILA